VYLPPERNCLLIVADHCLRSKLHQRDRRRQEASPADLAWTRRSGLTSPKGPRHLDFREHRPGGRSRTVVMHRRRRAPVEALAATPRSFGRRSPALSTVHHVVDLFGLMPDTEHPHVLSTVLDGLFTTDQAYRVHRPRLPVADHKLTSRRACSGTARPRYKEHGGHQHPLDWPSAKKKETRRTVSRLAIDRAHRCAAEGRRSPPPPPDPPPPPPPPRSRQGVVAERNLPALAYATRPARHAEITNWQWPG